MILLHKCIPIFSGILYHSARRPLTTATDRLISSFQSHLARQLIHGRILRIGILNRIHHRLANEQRTVLRILCPPFHQGFINRRQDALSASISAEYYNRPNHCAPKAIHLHTDRHNSAGRWSCFRADRSFRYGRYQTD